MPILIESVEKELEAEAIFFKIRRFRIFKLATNVGVKCNNNSIDAQNWTALFRAFTSNQQPSAYITKGIPQLFF